MAGHGHEITRIHLRRVGPRCPKRTTEVRKQADRLACEARNKRMLSFQGPAQPSPAMGDALNAAYLYLEVKCLGCDTHQAVALGISRRPKTTLIHELERYMRCKDCSGVRGYPYKRGHLVALRSTKISANDRASTWWPGTMKITLVQDQAIAARMALIVGADNVDRLFSRRSVR
jgi:hypothetical protein